MEKARGNDPLDLLSVLLKKGVKIPRPESVEIGPEVDPGRISGEGVEIHSGCRIFGASTLILPGVKIGDEAPVTIEDCQLGGGVELRGGFFKKAVFLENASMGSGAQVREGTILEEGASGAHCVGLKQTILFPFVTLGSLINFCDCFMAGGTDRKNHSEVGSSYIHFNYTPHQDKATPSLIGDVPRGVMLDQPPVFLGGQGGLVGPCRLEFGTVIAAGTVWRKDELRPGRLLLGGGGKGGSVPYGVGSPRLDRRIFLNNIIYIANLKALSEWYRWVRGEFISDDFPEELQSALRGQVSSAITERVHRLKDLVFRSAEGQKEGFAVEASSRWAEIEAALCRERAGSTVEDARDRFLPILRSHIAEKGNNYLLAIKGLGPEAAGTGTEWLPALVDGIKNNIIKILSIN